MRKLLILFVLCLAPAPALAQFMRGKVVMPDGSAPAQKALIERVCPSAKPVQEAVANKVGEFVWRINNDTTAYKLLTIGNKVPLRCTLRARITGFESNEIDIGDPVVLNNPELPRLILHPAGEAPAAELPKLSRATIKAWDLGTKAITTQQWPEAERYLRAVTQAAPGFGLAWSGLGYALQSQQKPAEARDAYRRAIAADPTSLLSRVQLARMEVAAKLWSEASATATALIAADREHRYPEAFLHHGLARYALKDYDGARTSLVEAIRLDSKREMPQAEYLLGAALNAKGDRAGAVEHLSRYLEAAPEAPNAAFVREQVARLTKPASVATPEPPLPVPDEILPAETEPVIAATGEARVPGGRKALATIARLPHVPEPSAFFPEYCRAVAEETSPLSHNHTPGYSAALEAFLESASGLADLGERRGDRTRIALSLAPDALPRTERALTLLGWKVVRGEGTVTVEPGDRAVDAPRHAVARALGIDETAMRDALNGGGTFNFEVASENVPLAGGSAWGALLQTFTSLPGGVAQGFVRQPRLARACAGLGRLEPAVAIALARSIGLRTLVNLYADSLWQHSDGFRVSGGRVVVPGGPEDVWAKLAGASPRDPAHFFEALLKSDKGRLAPFYAAVARGDAAHQVWFMKDATRAQRFYTWYRDAPRPLAPWRPLLFRDLPLDAAGSVRYPGGRPAWTTAASDEEVIAPIARVGNLRMIRSTEAVDLEALLAVARLERDRGRAFDAESAGLLWRHFAEWRDLFPYFAQLPAMGGSEFQALAGFATAAAATDPASQALVAAQWHSSVALILAARRAGSLDDAKAAQAFGDLCRALAATHPEAGAVRWLRSLASASSDLDEGLARLLRLSVPARAEFDRIRDLQHAPRFSALGQSPAPAAVASALSGAAYAVLLHSNGLLLNEDPRLLAKHVWAPRGQMFAAASLVASNSGDGSHFAGGFAGFEEIARTLASGGGDQAHSATSTATSAGDPSLGTLFRADARLVEVHTTVTEEGGRYLDGLAADRFSIRENGHAVPIASFEPATAPISCALVLDTSESMDAALPALKSAAAKLITSLRADDPVAVYTLGGSLSEMQPFTTDHVAAARAVGRAEPGGETALYDALIRVNRDLSARTGKKVIVVFTDGEDNASTLTAATAILRARTAGIPIYTIAQGHALNHSTLTRDLTGMSRATGGLSFTIAGPEEIGSVFRSILQDLLHGYLLAFRPPPVEDRAWRRIEVQVRAAPGHSVRAREGYYPE